MTVEKKEIVRYRLDRAREALDEARLLLDNDHLSGATNRLYYSMFYAAIALLATRDLKSSRHSGVIALFESNLVKDGTFPRELAHHLGRAFDLRTKSDYKDLVVPDRGMVHVLFEGAKAFIDKAEAVIRELA